MDRVPLERTCVFDSSLPELRFACFGLPRESILSSHHFDSILHAVAGVDDHLILFG